MSALDKHIPMLSAEAVSKTFRLHNQGGAELPVLERVEFSVRGGEAVVLGGQSGVGKSTFLRMLYGNYRPSEGRVLVRHDGRMVDITGANPRVLLDVRRRTMGWVSQFLRVIPRVSALDIVMDPLLRRGTDTGEARSAAGAMLARLNLPSRLWPLAPATFSGGEQQRVNIARAFVAPTPILLLDEPTASLDAANRDAVVELICEARNRGTAIVAIFHDEAVRDRAATRILDLTPFKPS
jgi:alpha-D-ribose 1-methylphosphonate 5-triphosphate synthase subunit PhnL